MGTEPLDRSAEPTDPGGELRSHAGSSRGVLLRICYSGTPFAGFAPQRGLPTVAGELLDALRHLDPTIRAVRGASRTDAGVHALEQPVAFDTNAPVPLKAWLLGTRRWLHEAIAVRSACFVPVGFAPRFAAQEKTYRYLVHCGHPADPLSSDRVWPVGPLGAERVAQATARELRAAQGTHRFDAFRSSRDKRPDTIRTITSTQADVVSAGPWYEQDAERRPREVVSIEIRGTAFLHNMVRILVGTAVDVARGRLAAGAVARALATGDRREAGITAPACGLYLAAVALGASRSHRAPATSLAEGASG